MTKVDLLRSKFEHAILTKDVDQARGALCDLIDLKDPTIHIYPLAERLRIMKQAAIASGAYKGW
jgi:hypothetical protein